MRSVREYAEADAAKIAKMVAVEKYMTTSTWRSGEGEGGRAKRVEVRRVSKGRSIAGSTEIAFAGGEGTE